jgi:hypothetical protein
MKKIYRTLLGAILGCAALVLASLAYVLLFHTRPAGMAMACVQAIGLVVAWWHIFPYVVKKTPDSSEDGPKK